MKSSENIANLAAALSIVQQHITPVVKDRTNPHFRNNYATLAAIMESVRPLLAGHGLSIVQGGGSPVSNNDGNVIGIAVETMLLHSSGEYITSAIVLPVERPSPQTIGSAITYGRRYGVAAVLALTTEEDDDANHATAANANPTATRSQAGGTAPAGAAPSPTAPSTAPTAPSTGSSASAAKKMPFGKHKGTPLGDINTSDLESTVSWCSTTDSEKFKDLIVACREVLNDRMVGSVMAGDEDDGFGEIPF